MTYDEKFLRAEQCKQDGAYERISESHPVPIFLGMEKQQRAIMVICRNRPPDPPVLASIAIEIRPRQNGEWALVVRLVRSELKTLFTRLAEDLDLATGLKPENPGEAVIARIARWQRLFSQGASNLLNDDELRGLAAELDFLLSESIKIVGPKMAVEAWCGPFDAPKDFVFEQAEVEIKSMHRQKDKLQISSLEQLSNAGLPLFVWTRVVELTSVETDDPNSIASLVSRVREAVSMDLIASTSLEQRLQAAMWEDRPEYNLRGVRFGSCSCYEVREDFPRLQRQIVNAAIASCKYEISISSIEQFKVPTWNIQNGR